MEMIKELISKYKGYLKSNPEFEPLLKCVISDFIELEDKVENEIDAYQCAIKEARDLD